MDQLMGQSHEKKRSLVIYHQIKAGVDCPDGIAAAWCAHRHLKNIVGGVDVLGCSYQEEPPDVSNYLLIYVVDFSFPRETIETWLGMGKQLVILDHHKTAQEMIGDVETFSRHFEFNFDLKESGATLAWRYFNYDREPPAFLQYVKDRDLWMHLLPMTAEIHEASANMRYELKKVAEITGLPPTGLIFSAFDYLQTLSQEQLIERMAERGFELLKPKREAIAKAASRMKYNLLPAREGGHYADAIPIVVLAEDGSENRLISDICALLHKQIPQAPFVACVASNGCDWSLRSDKDGWDFDVSAIAKLYGGGGHKNSAGFKVAST